MASSGTNKQGNARWYDEPKDNVHDCLLGVFRTVREESYWRVDADEYHLGLYAASDQPGVKGRTRRGYEYGPATLPYNLCRSAVDTLQAKIAKHRPLPQVLTSRASWKNQKRAKKMTQFLEGEFYRRRIFETHAPRIVRDALIFGRGVLRVHTLGEDICVERRHPWEVFHDEWDARYGEPRNIFDVHSMDRGVALATYARSESGGWKQKAKEAIEAAGRFDIANLDEREQTSTVDRVDILEAWHLCDDHDDKKAHKCTGRHVVVVQGATLVDEPYEHPYFPHVVLNYSEAVVGTFGHGLVEQLEGYQYEINMASQKSSEQHRMSGVGILVPDGSGIHDQQIRNGINILRHKPGMPPQVFQMDLVNEHTRQRPRELTQDGLNDAGLSQMSVQSEKPAGVTAAIAIQTLDDIETERFMIFGRAYEAWCLEIARRFIDCAKAIAEEYGDMAVSVPMKGGLVDLKWNDVYVDGIELKVFPTSLLPQQLGARLEKLKDLFNTQVINASTFLRLLEAPDLAAEIDLVTSGQILVDEILEKLLDADEEQGEDAYYPPNAYIDLKWAAPRCQQKLDDAWVKGADEFNLDLLRRWLKDCQEELKKLEPPPPPPVPPMPMPVPGAPPMPPPPAPPMAA